MSRDTTIEFEDEEGRELLAEVDYTVENDGIGEYEYWGCKGYDYGQDYCEIEDIKVYAILRGSCDTKDEIPKCKDVIRVQKLWKGYDWIMGREIDAEPYMEEVQRLLEEMEGIQ